MSYKIVVARFNENIDYLHDEIDNCIIYNKGNIQNIQNEYQLENVGREAHTYLEYIINNYDKLPDIVVFTQAKISDHLGSDNVSHLINIKNSALEHTKSQNIIIHYQSPKNNICWDKEWNINIGNGFYSEPRKYKNNKVITFIDWFKENINNEYPNPIYIYHNAIFAVNKQLITKNPIEYYKKLILEVNYTNDPIEAHFLERSWYYIF